MAVLAQAPAGDLRGPVAVVLVSKRPGADPFPAKVAARIIDVAKREGIASPMDEVTAAKELKAAGFSDPKSCDGATSCLVKLAVLMGPKAVVIGVDVGKVAKSLAIHLEAVTADGEQTLASVDLMAPADNWGDKVAADITRFVRKVKEGLVRPSDLRRPADDPKVVKTPKDAPKEPVKDAPKVATLEPKPKDPEVMETFEADKGGGGAKVLPWALGGGTVLAAGAAVGLAVMGSGDKAKYDAALVTTPDGLKGTTLTQAEAQALAGSANGKFTGALVSAVVAAGLGAATAWAFTKD